MPASSNDNSIEPRLLRISEAAKYLGATSWFVRSLIWAGSISHCKFGKRLLIDIRDLDVFIATQKEGAR